MHIVPDVTPFMEIVNTIFDFFKGAKVRTQATVYQGRFTSVSDRATL